MAIVTMPSPFDSTEFSNTYPHQFSSQNYSDQTHSPILVPVPVRIRIRVWHRVPIQIQPFPFACNAPVQHDIDSSYSPDCVFMLDGSKLCRWRRPTPKYVAVNCDASFHPRKEHVGYGFIVRDHHGQVIMAKAKCKKIFDREGFNGPILVLKTEMMAIRDGLRDMAQKREDFPCVEVQSDSKNAVDILNGHVKGPQECDDVLKEIYAVSGLFKECCFQFVYREGNLAADFMSKYLESDGEEYLSWLPPNLENIVDDDACGIYVHRSRKH